MLKVRYNPYEIHAMGRDTSTKKLLSIFFGESQPIFAYQMVKLKCIDLAAIL